MTQVCMNTIPEDILGYILCFGWSPSLCLVCRRWSALTHLRHLFAEEDDKLETELLKRWQPLSLRLHFDTLLGFLQFISDVEELPSLQRLTFALRVYEASDSIGLALRLVERYNNLTYFDLEFLHTTFTPKAFRGMADGLLQLRNLNEMYFCAIYSAIKENEALELSRLGGLQELQKLHLNLHCCSVRGVALRHIMGLWQMPRLRHLVLDLSSTEINCNDHGPAAEALSLLKDAPALAVLHLNVSFTYMNAADAAQLASWKFCPALRRLILKISHNEIGTEGFAAMLGLLHCPTLTACRLDASNNRIRHPGKEHLLEALKRREQEPLPALQLEVGLGGNE
eukprot:RCo042348